MFHILLVVAFLSAATPQTLGCDSQDITDVPACSSFIQSEVFFKAAKAVGYNYGSFNDAPRIVYEPGGATHYSINEDTIYVNDETNPRMLFLMYGLALVVSGRVDADLSDGFLEEFMKEFEPVGENNANP